MKHCIRLNVLVLFLSASFNSHAIVIQVGSSFHGIVNINYSLLVVNEKNSTKILTDKRTISAASATTFYEECCFCLCWPKTKIIHSVFHDAGEIVYFGSSNTSKEYILVIESVASGLNGIDIKHQFSLPMDISQININIDANMNLDISRGA